MPVSSLNEWLPPVAAALDFVHKQGYVHRDVKPGNILFDAHGNAYVSDFGIAKVVAGGANCNVVGPETRAGVMWGSRPYMPPEMLGGGGYDGRADQYALAITVYEALSGRMPFPGGSAQQILKQQILGELVPLHKLVPASPPALWQVLARALGSEPQQRFTDCATFAAAVRSVATASSAGVVADQAPGRDAGVRVQPAKAPRAKVDERQCPELILLDDPERVAAVRPAPTHPPSEVRVRCVACGKAISVPAGARADNVRCTACAAVAPVRAGAQAPGPRRPGPTPPIRRRRRRRDQRPAGPPPRARDRTGAERFRGAQPQCGGSWAAPRRSCCSA